MNIYGSLLDVPLDTVDPDEDGDDRLVPNVGPFDAPVQVPPLLTPLQAMETAIVVPFFPLKRNSYGRPVRALNRALARAGFRQWSPLYSLLFTIWVERSLKRFQASRGLPATGRYDLPTHKKLALYYDAYGIKYLLEASLPPKATKDELERAAFIAKLTYLYNRRMQLAYTQRRPFDCSVPPRGLDCSASGEWAGEHSPINSLSGFPGCGYGNTDTQLSRYRHLGRVRFGSQGAKPGDPVYYGSGGDPSHVGYWLSSTRLWTFGSFPVKIAHPGYRPDMIAICNLTGRP